MNIPSYTAEASLYKARGHYQAKKPAINSLARMVNAISLAMIRIEGIDCGNCVGAECVELRCFESWTQGGGGSGGPYQGGGSSGGWVGRSGGVAGGQTPAPSSYRKECKRVPYWICVEGEGCRTEYGTVCTYYPVP